MFRSFLIILLLGFSCSADAQTLGQIQARYDTALARITRDITIKSASRSITPTNVGSNLDSLAKIGKDAAALSASAGDLQGSLNLGNTASNGSGNTGSIVLSDAFAPVNNCNVSPAGIGAANSLGETDFTATGIYHENNSGFSQTVGFINPTSNTNQYFQDENGIVAMLDDTIGGSGLGRLTTAYSSINIGTGSVSATGNYTHSWGGHTTLFSNVGSWKIDNSASIHLLNLNSGAPTLGSMLFANSTSNAASMATKEGYVQLFGQYSSGNKTLMLQNGSTNTERFSSLAGTDTWEVKLNSQSMIKCDSSDNSVKILGVYKLPLSDGSSGQVMQTDGAGNVTFQTPPGSTFTDRKIAQTAATTLAPYTVGASDESLEISANVLITTSTTFTFVVNCAYTDEGNTSRTLTMTFSSIAGALLNAMTNVGGAVPYEGVPLHIRAKTGTTVTLSTANTFTAVTYNFEEAIRKY